MTTSEPNNAFPRGRWSTPMFTQAAVAPAGISTASPSRVPSDDPGGGSEQNSQPRLASEEADIRQVPSNAGAVDDLNAECGVRNAEPDGHPLTHGRREQEGTEKTEGMQDGHSLTHGREGAPAEGSRPTEPDGQMAANASSPLRPAGPDSCPLLPGSKDGESIWAAGELAACDAELTREQVLSLLLCHDFNADTLAFLIRKDVHNVRSRCSELAHAGSIFFSGRYSSENNPNGIKTKVWTTRRPQFLTAKNAENTKT